MGTYKTPTQTNKGPGRPRLQEGQDTQPVTIRLTGEQKEKLARLGGSPWIRERIEKAKDPRRLTASGKTPATTEGGYPLRSQSTIQEITMAQIISFAAARAARTATLSAPAPKAIRKPAAGRHSFTAAQAMRRDAVRAKARAAL